MTTIEKNHESTLPPTDTGTVKPDPGKTEGEKVVKPETATPDAPKKDPEAKPAITEPAHKNG